MLGVASPRSGPDNSAERRAPALVLGMSEGLAPTLAQYLATTGAAVFPQLNRPVQAGLEGVNLERPEIQPRCDPRIHVADVVVLCILETAISAQRFDTEEDLRIGAPWM